MHIKSYCNELEIFCKPVLLRRLVNVSNGLLGSIFGHVNAIRTDFQTPKPTLSPSNVCVCANKFYNRSNVCQCIV